MTIDEAIEILDELKDAVIDAVHYDAEDAIQLGIEALKAVQSIRRKHPTHTVMLLPGETEA